MKKLDILINFKNSKSNYNNNDCTKLWSIYLIKIKFAYKI